MKEQFERTCLLLGEDAVTALQAKRVAVFGLGGVGGAAVEALARAGIGSFLLIDNDKVTLSNINRQVIALYSTVGELKTKAMTDRILDINPAAQIDCLNTFVLSETVGEIDLTSVDYVIDAIDTISGKLAIVEKCIKSGIPIISSMGAGNRLIPDFKVADISQTKVCAVAKVMRRELKKRGIEKLKVVYSSEPAREHFDCPSLFKEGRPKKVIGSVSFVPPALGLVLAAAVIADLTA